MKLIYPTSRLQASFLHPVTKPASPGVARTQRATAPQASSAAAQAAERGQSASAPSVAGSALHRVLRPVGGVAFAVVRALVFIGLLPLALVRALRALFAATPQGLPAASSAPDNASRQASATAKTKASAEAAVRPAAPSPLRSSDAGLAHAAQDAVRATPPAESPTAPVSTLVARRVAKPSLPRRMPAAGTNVAPPRARVATKGAALARVAASPTPALGVSTAPVPTVARFPAPYVRLPAQQPVAEFLSQRAETPGNRAPATVRLEIQGSGRGPVTLTFTPAAIALFRETFDRHAGPTAERRVALQAYLVEKLSVVLRKLVAAKDVRALEQEQAQEAAAGAIAKSNRKSWTLAGDLPAFFAELLQAADAAPLAAGALAIEMRPMAQLLVAPNVPVFETYVPPLFDARAWASSSRYAQHGAATSRLHRAASANTCNRLRQIIFETLVARSLHTQRLGVAQESQARG